MTVCFRYNGEINSVHKEGNDHLKECLHYIYLVFTDINLLI